MVLIKSLTYLCGSVASLGKYRVHSEHMAIEHVCRPTHQTSYWHQNYLLLFKRKLLIRISPCSESVLFISLCNLHMKCESINIEMKTIRYDPQGRAFLIRYDASEFQAGKFPSLQIWCTIQLVTSYQKCHSLGKGAWVSFPAPSLLAIMAEKLSKQGAYRWWSHIS